MRKSKNTLLLVAALLVSVLFFVGQCSNNSDNSDHTTNSDIGIESNHFDELVGADGVVSAENSSANNLDLYDSTPELTQSSRRHILWGEINRSGKAVGGHFFGAIDSGSLRIRPGTEILWLEHKICRALIDIRDRNGNWAQKIAKTTFFPSNWSEKVVLSSVVFAFQNRVYKGENIYQGYSGRGFDIRMYLKTDGSNEIITAFPNLR